MMSYDKKAIQKGFSSLVSSISKSSTRVIKEVASRDKPALLSFDDVETITIPTKSSVQVFLSGPNVDENLINSYEIEELLNEKAKELTDEILVGLKKDLERIL